MVRKVSKNRIIRVLYLMFVYFLICFIFSLTLISNYTASEGPDSKNVQDWIFLRLNKDVFDPLREGPDIPDELKTPISQGYYIVQFNGPIQEHQRQCLEDLGALIMGYIPDYAYLVKLDEKDEMRIGDLPQLRWMGLYHPGYKVHTELPGKTGIVELNVVVYRDDPDHLYQVRDVLEKLGGRITYSGEGSHIIRTQIDASKIRNIAFIPQVMWLDLYEPPVREMNNIRSYTGASNLQLSGFDGTGIVGEVKDGGIDQSHPDFVGQLIGTDGTIYADAHGTSTFGIVFSSGANNADAMGMLPEAGGVFCEYSEGRYTSIGNLTNNWGGVFQSNSWSTGPRNGEYASESYENDLAIFDYDVTMLYSAGNSQAAPVGPETTTSDSSAKNVICVGGVNHFDNTDWSDDRWVNAGPWATPSQGPTADGRIKPDVCGPFDKIFTTDSTVYTWDTGQKGYDDASDYYDDFGGTSGAAPVAAGVAGLIYQMYKENHFSNNPTNDLPHASTVKAIMIADAHQYEFSRASRYQQGWGSVDVQNVYDIGSHHFIVDETDALKTGEDIIYSVSPTGGGPLKISLVWTDVPASPGSDPSLVNNLNLKVTDPLGTIYHGNNGLTGSKWSSAGGSADFLNNVENVFVENPISGTWTIEINAENVPSDGDGSTPEVDQAFSLVASNVYEALSARILNPKHDDFVSNITTISGIASIDATLVEININGGSWQPASGTFTWTYDWDTKGFSDGPHVINVRAFNGTDFSQVVSINVSVDNTPPSTSIIIDIPKYDNGSLWIVGPSNHFSLSADDGTGSGEKASYYKLFREGTEVKSLTQGNNFSLTWGEGNYEIHYHSDDDMGNEEGVNIGIIYVDETPPETKIDIGNPRYRSSQGDIWNITSNTPITLLPFEEYSEVETVWYTIDGNYFEGENFDLNGYSHGYHSISWGSRDVLGNIESMHTLSVNIDNAPPIVELIIEEPKYRESENDSWLVSPLTIFRISASDTSSAVNFSWYTIDGIYFEKSDFRFIGYVDRFYSIICGAEDYLGNNASTPVEIVYLDSKSPKTHLDIEDPNYYSSVLSGYVVLRSTTFNLTAFDDYGGVRTTWYTINGIYHEGVLFNCSNFTEGPIDITYGGLDNLSQNSTAQSITVYLDTEAPLTDLIIGSPQYNDTNGNLIVSCETPFTLAAHDNYSGVKFTWYIIDGFYFEGPSFSFKNYSGGNHTINWGSCDQMWHYESKKEMRVYVQKDPPETGLEIAGRNYRDPETDEWYITFETQFSLDPITSTIKIDYPWYVIDNDFFIGDSFDLEGYQDGQHTINWGRKDILGLNESGNSIIVFMDTKAPDTAIEIGEPNFKENPQENIAVNASTVFTLTAIDDHSGVNFTWYKIDGNFFFGSNFTLKNCSGGLNKIVWGGCDNLGNNITQDMINVNLDNSPPITLIEIDKPILTTSEIVYVTSDTMFFLYAYDALGVGYEFIRYSLDGGKTQMDYLSSFTIPQDTTSIIYWAVDFVGNSAQPMVINVVVDESDNDSDGIYDVIDPDDDNDGILDENDAFPLDTDNDGIDNEVDSDDDCDGIPDDDDLYPLDTDNDNIRNDKDHDDDNDGIDDTQDSRLYDTDNDGEKNDFDEDDDGDGLSDAKEDKIGTDPLKYDTDGDKRSDKDDAFPLDKTRWDNGLGEPCVLLIICGIGAVAFILFLVILHRHKRSTDEDIDTKNGFRQPIDTQGDDMTFEMAGPFDIYFSPPPPFPPPPPPPV